MTHIIAHLPVGALEQLYRVAQDATEARHTQALWLLAQGRSVLDVAGVLAFAPRWVEQLAAGYNAHGPAALGDQRRRNGRAASVLSLRCWRPWPSGCACRPRMAGAGLVPESPSGWRGISGWSGCTRSVEPSGSPDAAGKR